MEWITTELSRTEPSTVTLIATGAAWMAFVLLVTLFACDGKYGKGCFEEESPEDTETSP